MRITVATGLSGIALAAALATSAQAQDNAEAADPTQNADEQEAGQPADNILIVTAQKREERLIDVPIAITALSSAELDQHKIEGGAELLRAVPNSA